MEEFIILVNDQDEETGYGEKLDVHIKAQLHRAFSIFIYDCQAHKMLIQKRAEGKYHSGGLWSNACCSHPRKGEIMEEALARRLEEELGFLMPEKLTIVSCDNLDKTITEKEIIETGKFQYFAQFEGLAEHEIDHVFVYYPCREQIEQMVCNPEEIGDIQWIDMGALCEWNRERPEDFSAWFAPALKLACRVLEQ
ncbi:isopentenyl-diphosphate Delta-isomerase [Frisingicoccus sp.]|uniref:isopentenyl-diphosphate Delta-isomerase n=1 Tax=Frisingicoccus sp. TaxID=1918627 RepID=UPI002E9EAA43|nr:isopentenyl-diphosphate Delta-isomerase [Frisingicoccus sp.]